MAHAFYGCWNKTLSVVANPDLSQVTDISYMFAFAGSLNQPIGNWNVSNLTDTSYMFDGAQAFNQPIGN